MCTASNLKEKSSDQRPPADAVLTSGALEGVIVLEEQSFYLFLVFL